MPTIRPSGQHVRQGAQSTGDSRGRWSGSAELCASQHYSAAFNRARIHVFINAKQQEAAEERRGREPLRYPLCLLVERKTGADAGADHLSKGVSVLNWPCRP